MTGDDWLVGDRPRVRFLVVDEEADPPVALDPHTVRFIVRPPTGPRVTFVYGTDPDVIHDASGNFYIDIPLTLPGTWRVRAEGLEVAGHALLARETCVEARPSSVLP
jgi:hypothetical protein